MTVYAVGPGESPGFLLWRVTLRWQRLMTEALRPLGLTHVQFVLLASSWWLSRDGQAPNQLAIATHAGTNGDRSRRSPASRPRARSLVRGRA